MPLPSRAARRRLSLVHHESFRALAAAAAPLAALTARLARAEVRADLSGALALATADLAAGFAAPAGSEARITAHRRAWVGVRGLDRALREVVRRRLASGDAVLRAQRAVDRADVMIAALPGVLPQ